MIQKKMMEICDGFATSGCDDFVPVSIPAAPALFHTCGEKIMCVPHGDGTFQSDVLDA